jgi:cardiolipin synthase A/B
VRRAHGDRRYELAEFRHQVFARLRKPKVKPKRTVPDAELLFCGPGRGRNPIKTALHRDLKNAREIRIAMAYFLPTWRIRRLIMRAARQGARVQLMLPAQSDVRLSQLASRWLYASMLRAGVEIHEYEPQVLHTKLILIDGITYVGSANLDRRSLHINYELMIRLEDATVAREARERFETDLTHCRRIELRAWRRSRTWWTRLQEQGAWLILAQLDPYWARLQIRHIGRG